MSSSYSGKILVREKASGILRRHRQAGRQIVFTNGCFDVLHRGHLELLLWARRQGDILVVALNSDESVRRLKGPTRPVNTLADRACLLAAMECVDYVTSFHEDTPAAVIKSLLPDVLVKGGDYPDATKIVGYHTVTERGGRVLVAPFLHGYSTTQVLQRANALG